MKGQECGSDEEIRNTNTLLRGTKLENGHLED